MVHGTPKRIFLQKTQNLYYLYTIIVSIIINNEKLILLSTAPAVKSNQLIVRSTNSIESNVIGIHN